MRTSLFSMSTKQSMAWCPLSSLSLISAPAVHPLQGSGRSCRMQRLIGLGLAAHGCNAAGVAQNSHLRGAATSGLGQLGEGLYPWLALAGWCWLYHVMVKLFSKKRSTSWRPEVFPKRSNHSFDAKASKKRRSECNFSKDSYQVMAHLVVSWPHWKFFFRRYVVRHFHSFNLTTHQLRCVTGRLALRETIEAGLLVHLPMHVVHLSKGIKLSEILLFVLLNAKISRVNFTQQIKPQMLRFFKDPIQTLRYWSCWEHWHLTCLQNSAEFPLAVEDNLA